MNVKELEIEKQEIQDKINRIQEECSHPADCVTYKAGSNTGNYDPSCDSYWRDYTCDLCEKRWHVSK